MKMSLPYLNDRDLRSLTKVEIQRRLKDGNLYYPARMNKPELIALYQRNMKQHLEIAGIPTRIVQHPVTRIMFTHLNLNEEQGKPDDHVEFNFPPPLQAAFENMTFTMYRPYDDPEITKILTRPGMNGPEVYQQRVIDIQIAETIKHGDYAVFKDWLDRGEVKPNMRLNNQNLFEFAIAQTPLNVNIILAILNLPGFQIRSEDINIFIPKGLVLLEADDFRIIINKLRELLHKQVDTQLVPVLQPMMPEVITLPIPTIEDETLLKLQYPITHFDKPKITTLPKPTQDVTPLTPEIPIPQNPISPLIKPEITNIPKLQTTGLNTELPTLPAKVTLHL